MDVDGNIESFRTDSNLFGSTPFTRLKRAFDEMREFSSLNVMFHDSTPELVSSVSDILSALSNSHAYSNTNRTIETVPISFDSSNGETVGDTPLDDGISHTVTTPLSCTNIASADSTIADFGEV